MSGQPQPPFRLRMLISLVLAASVVGGGLALERVLGARPLTPEEVSDAVSGAWFCPHGGSPRWRVWVVVANAGGEPAQVRLVTYGTERPASEVTTVDPGTQRYLEVQAEEEAAASAVEYFGGPVAAGMVISRTTGRGDPLGRAAEPCLSEAGRRWYLPEGTTLRGHDQRVVIANPFPQEAVVNLRLTDEEETVEPGALQGIVLAPRRSIAVDLGEYALGKETLAATVDVPLGKVAAAGIGISRDGLRASVGVPAAATTWVLPGAADEHESALTLLGTSRSEAPFRARLQSDEAQREVVSEASVPAGRTATLRVPAAGAGLLVAAEGPEPFVAGRRLAGPADLGSIAGAPSAGAAWVATPVSRPEGGSAALFVENPGAEVAEVRISLLTENGPEDVPDLPGFALRPGRTRIVDLSELLGEDPVSVVVRARTGTVVAGQAARAPDGYAIAMGAPLAVPPSG